MKEREVYKKAGRQVGQKNESPGKLELFIKHAPAIHGTDFDVIIEVHNAGREDTDAQLTVTSNAITYNSIHRGECQRKTTSLTVPAHKGKKTSKLSTLNYAAHSGICKQISLLIQGPLTVIPKISLHHFLAHKEVLRLQYDHYGACVSEHHMIRVIALLQPTDQDNIILQEVNIPLKMPALHIKVIKGIVHPNIKKNSLIIYSHSCHPRCIKLSIFIFKQTQTKENNPSL